MDLVTAEFRLSSMRVIRSLAEAGVTVGMGQIWGGRLPGLGFLSGSGCLPT